MVDSVCYAACTLTNWSESAIMFSRYRDQKLARRLRTRERLLSFWLNGEQRQRFYAKQIQDMTRFEQSPVIAWK